MSSDSSPMAASDLYDRVAIKRPIDTLFGASIFFLLLSLLGYRLHFLCTNGGGFSWLQSTAFLCEFWFTFIWFLYIAIKWNPVHFNTYPDRLLKRVEEIPAVDVFVTTADSSLEPPIITVNTVLSILAVDYPVNKLACYVSDDGCSPLTFYCLTEAVQFARIWVPFCKKHQIRLRAPFRYFSTALPHKSPEFQLEWKRIKVEYEKLCRKIQIANQTSDSRGLAGDLAVFSGSGTDSKNHAPIIETIGENREYGDEIPPLIYVSREKRLQHAHNYKAGAMNVLTRVSGLMTNAPYILNVDCDMFVNDSNAILQGICPFLNPKNDKEVAYVQFPQRFYDGLKDDLYGNQFLVHMEYIVPGLAGSQGPSYMGTGCIHRRKVLYGQLPNEDKINETKLNRTFGNSEDFIESATSALMGIAGYPNSLRCSIEALHKVASCSYEHHTSWGSQVGWYYGSATEDILTGMMIQSKGWKSIYLNPNPPAFLGCSPANGPSTFTQLKRWTTGFLEILFTKKYCPIFGTLFGELHLRLCMFYVWIYLWGLQSIPELCYALLPAYCLITNSHFLPEVQEREICIPLLILVLYSLQQVLQFLKTGQSVTAYWNNQRMARINTMGPFFFGLVGIMLKFLGLSETTFEVTKKESSSSSDHDGQVEVDGGDSNEFIFDESSLFVPGTTVLMIQLTALFMSIWRRPAKPGGVGEVMCSVWLILCFWPFLKGLFRKGRYGLPFSTICKATAFTLLFVFLSEKTKI